MSTTFYSTGLDNWSSSYKGTPLYTLSLGLILADNCTFPQFVHSLVLVGSPSDFPLARPSILQFVGILLLNLTNQFKEKHLESAYQRYSQRQRQKSLVILNLIDILLKVVFLIAYFHAESTLSPSGTTEDATLQLHKRHTQLNLTLSPGTSTLDR